MDCYLQVDKTGVIKAQPPFDPGDFMEESSTNELLERYARKTGQCRKPQSRVIKDPPLRKAHYYAEQQGNVFEFKVRNPRKTKPAKRGDVTSFSQAARLRMLKFFHRIDFEHFVQPIFITLTYPDARACPRAFERADHKRKFLRRMEAFTRKEIPCAWRLEWEARKSGSLIGMACPHWHLLVFRHDFIDYREVNRMWCETIHWDGYCRTETRGIRDDSPVRLYMAKYLSKDAISPSLVFASYQTTVLPGMKDPNQSLGRAYGWCRKEKIPVYPRKVWHGLSEGQRRDLMRLAEEQLPWIDGTDDESFTLFGPPDGNLAEILGEPLTTV
jgi:hypothetical protein